MIHEWKNTLCVHSKYKEDLVHIRDMHRLLSYKGEFHLLDWKRATDGSRVSLQVVRRCARNGQCQPE